MTPPNNETSNTPATGSVKPRSWAIVLSGAFGGFLAAIIDNLSNGDASITVKLMSRYFDGFNNPMTQVTVAILVGVVGGIICWIYTPNSKPDGFMRGLTIFTALNLISPYGGNSTDNHGASSTDTDKINKYTGPQQVNEASLIPALIQIPSSQDFNPNATITEFESTEWVSSIKPYTTLGSIFSGSIYYREIDGETLSKGQQVEIVDTYITPFREFKYVKIRYKDKSEALKEGWIKAGEESKWRYVKPAGQESSKK